MGNYLILKEYLKKSQQEIDQFLDENMPKPSEKPSIIFEAMRYSVFAGGKRIRPIISFMINDMLGGEKQKIYYPACAIELIHTYSLIHDDLPALDNDDFRRGKPSSHKQFGEAIAILTGDSLLTLAFQWIAKTKDSPDVITKILDQVSVSSGVYGMIGGQVADLQAEGKIKQNEMDLNKNKSNYEKELEYIHLHKTAALIRASVMIGAISAGADQEDFDRCYKFGTLIGLAFQVADDILDVEGDQELLGKTIGKDANSDKLTYPSVYGLEESKKKARDLINMSKDILSHYDNNNILIQLSDMIIQRES